MASAAVMKSSDMEINIREQQQDQQCASSGTPHFMRWFRPLKFATPESSSSALEQQSSAKDKKERRNRTDFRNLPIEIQLHIFRYLDVKDLCRASAVCRDWYAVTSSNILWRHRLDTDMRSWEVIGHLTQPNHHEVYSAPKKAYLRCSPQANQRSLSARGNKKFRLPSLFKKTPHIAMLGPGLESGAVGMVQRIVAEQSTALRVSGLFPGVDGVGAGIGLKLSKADVNLITLYHRTRAERRGLVEQRPSRIFDAASGFFNDRIQTLCKTLSGLVFLVDASTTFLSDKKEVEEARLMLTAMLDARWTSRDTPFIMFAIRKKSDDDAAEANNNTNTDNEVDHNDGETKVVKIPSLVEIARRMQLSTLSRPWQLRYLDPTDFQEPLAEGLEWLASWQ